MTDTDTRLRQIVADQLDVEFDQITPEARLREGLNADNVDIAIIAIAAEEVFGVELSDETVDAARTYGDLLRAVIPTPTGAAQ